MLKLDLFYDTPLTDLEKRITKYVNKNVESIIRVLMDFLEDNCGFTSEDFLPYNNLRIDNDTWNEMVYDLYDTVRSDVIRDYIKPKYEFLLYVILQWWDDCNSGPDTIPEDKILNTLDSDLVDKIKNTYTSEDGDNYVLSVITSFEEYYSILFANHDFLPASLDRLTIMYLRNPEQYKILFADVDLKEYRELMPKDLLEQFEALCHQLNEPSKKGISETTLLHDLFSCIQKL
ncbi:hypothetical protein MASR2M41_24990 [Flammeovirgaceae bacterium]